MLGKKYFRTTAIAAAVSAAALTGCADNSTSTTPGQSVGGGSDNQTVTATPTVSTATPLPSTSVSVTPTAEPVEPTAPVTPVPTDVPVTPTNSVNPTTVVTPTDSVDPTAAVTPTDSVDPTAAVTPTNSVDPTAVVTPTDSVDPTAVVTPTDSVDPTAVVTPTDSVDPTAVVTPTDSVDPTTAVTPTDSVDPTAVVTPTASVDPTVVVTPTDSVDPTAVVTPTDSVDPTAVVTPTDSVDPTAVVTPTDSVDPTAVVTPTDSVDPTAVVTPTDLVDPTTVVTPTKVVTPTAVPVLCESPEYDKSLWATYALGDLVTHNGKQYKVVDTNGRHIEPDHIPSPAWELIKDCGTTSVTATPSPSATPTTIPSATVTPTSYITPTITPTGIVSPTLIVTPTGPVSAHEACRPEGLWSAEGVTPPYCDLYDENGVEKEVNGMQRRVIAYYTTWRNGQNEQPHFLAHQIPWDSLTHINYAFAHIDNNYRVSVGEDVYPGEPGYVPAAGAHTEMVWPNIPGATEADMDPTLPYKGHLNLLNTHRKGTGVKTLVSVGGWAATGGFWGPNTGDKCPLGTLTPASGDIWTLPGGTLPDGTVNNGPCPIDDLGRVMNGGFYSMTSLPDGSINHEGIAAFAKSSVDFIRAYGFDGIDLDYEYPTSLSDGGNPYDRAAQNSRRDGLMASYNEMMRVLREALDQASIEDGKYYMLTVAVPSSGYLLRGMEVYSAGKYLDYINMMTYDFAGSWGAAVGHNASLYDNGREPEMNFYNVYNSYGDIGYLNVDWAYRYYRGIVPAGRLNIGIPYYTRGWKNVTANTSKVGAIDNGYSGWAPLPVSECTRGTGSGDMPCGDGAIGIDNIWHDRDGNAQEIVAGANPLWHVLNLQKGIVGSYMKSYFPESEWTDAKLNLEGTYVEHFDDVAGVPWVWNEQKKVMLSTENERSFRGKVQYVIDNGIGGIMFWELAGDYQWNAAKGEYEMGSTLTDIGASMLRGAGPYDMNFFELPGGVQMPTQALDVSMTLKKYPTDDNAWPQATLWTFTNNSDVTVDSVSFNVASSTNLDMQHYGTGYTVDHAAGVTGNTGAPGVGENFHRLTFTLSLKPGASKDMRLNTALPAGGGPTTVVLNTAQGSYGLAQEFTKLAVYVKTCASEGVSTVGLAEWVAGTYVAGDRVLFAGQVVEAKYSNSKKPDLSNKWGEWKSLCIVQ